MDRKSRQMAVKASLYVLIVDSLVSVDMRLVADETLSMSSWLETMLSQGAKHRKGARLISMCSQKGTEATVSPGWA